MVCSERISLYCKGGKGSSSEAAETQSVEREQLQKAKGKNTEWKFPDCTYAISIWIFFCQQKLKGELSFPSSPCYKNPILMLLVSDAVSLLQHPAAPCSNTLPPVLSPAPNLASELHQLSLSHSYSHSQTQRLLPLLQHPFQNPIRSIGKNNYKLLPGCQTPL